MRTKWIDLIATLYTDHITNFLFWYVNFLSRIKPKYLHSSVGFNEGLLISMQFKVFDFLFIKVIICVSIHLELTCFVSYSVKFPSIIFSLRF